MDNIVIQAKAVFNAVKELKTILEGIKNSYKIREGKNSFLQFSLASSFLKARTEENLKTYNEYRNMVIGWFEQNIIPYCYIPSVNTEIPTISGGILAQIDLAIVGCSTIMSICESLIKPKIPQESLDKLNQLRVEVEKIEDYLPADKQFLTKNIAEAIKEYEQGHFLASALIASRVIMYVYEQIPSESDSKPTSSDMTEQKVETLIKKGIIDKKRRDEKANFIKASKMARNTLSHQIDTFPPIDEALSLVASAITFCKYYIVLTRY
jgi:hypothetical protein